MNECMKAFCHLIISLNDPVRVAYHLLYLLPIKGKGEQRCPCQRVCVRLLRNYLTNHRAKFNETCRK